MREKIVANVLQNCTFLANGGLLKLFVILSSGSVLNGRESAFITHLHYYLRRVKLSWPDPDKKYFVVDSPFRKTGTISC